MKSVARGGNPIEIELYTNITIVKLDKVGIALVEGKDEWLVPLDIGSHVLEVGEKGQRGWKVYITVPAT